MRLKHVWTYVPLPAYARLFWERVTFSRLTTIYLAFSIIHFLIQLALQSKAFAINATAFNAGTALVLQGNAVIKGLPIYNNSTLRVCNWVPSDLNLEGDFCYTIWPPPQDNTTSQQDNLAPTSAYYVNSPSSAPRLGPTPDASLLITYAPSTTPTIPSVSSSVSPDRASQSTSVTQEATSSTVSVAPVVSPISSVPAAPVITTVIAPEPVTTTSGASSVIGVTSVVPATVTSTVVAVPTPVAQTQTPPAVIPTGINNSGNSGPVNGDNDDDEKPDQDDQDSQSDEDGEDENPEPGSEDDESEDDVVHLLQRETDTATEATGIDAVCLQALSYPLSILENTKREDIVFIAFQFWVLGMSVVALLNESIPHILASLVTHVVATAWGSFQLVHTANFRSQFVTLITKGACKDASQIPITSNYWEDRRAAEVSSLTLNVLALVVSCFLSWRLFKLFGWQTFKRVGASRVINRMYKLVLILSITIQLSLFFMAVTVSLWLDRLISNVIGDLADLRKVYLASCIITLILLVPWLMMGWFGARRELRIPMLIFLGLCVMYLGGWGVMFVSTTFRWTFMTWRFFSIIAVASVLLTISCLILGLLCRMNFGKGLLHYLSTQETLPAAGEFGIVTPEYEYEYDDEKVEFPSTERPMPTFNATYGNQFSGRGQPFISNGPRFYNQAPQPGAAVVLPPHALTRAPSDKSTHSYSSEKSASSWESYYNYSHSRNNSGQYGHSKRWVIE